MARSKKWIFAITALLVIVGSKHVHQSYKVNQSDVQLYNSWYQSLDNTRDYLNKAMEEDIREPTDTINAVSQYYVSHGLRQGIITSSLKESIYGLQGWRLDDKMDRMHQPSPTSEEVESALKSLNRVLDRLPNHINSLSDLPREDLEYLQ